MGRRRARWYVGAASQRFADGKHHHGHQETLDAKRDVDASETAPHDARVSHWHFQLLLLARSSIRRLPTVQFHPTFRFLCISSSYVNALQDTVVALRTYTTHEAGPHDDGFFVHHLCVLRREGRVRSVPPLFRSSRANRTTAFFRFHPSCVHLFFFAGILASACVGCRFHVRVGFSPCFSFSSRSDASWRAFVSRISSRRTWDGLSNLEITSPSSRLASSPAMEHLRSTPLFPCRFHPLERGWFVFVFRAPCRTIAWLQMPWCRRTHTRSLLFHVQKHATSMPPRGASTNRSLWQHHTNHRSTEPRNGINSNKTHKDTHKH